MKVSKDWLQELIDLKIPMEEVEKLLPLRTIGTKEITEDFIELDMKGYNRADLLSMRGVAREVAAITDSKITFQDHAEHVWNGQGLPSTPVSVETEELSPLKAVAKIEGLKVESSPKEWVKKLEDSGMRTVNNLVDVTNLIMLEYGHPLHAFDVKTVKDETINVRLAKPNEEITTLDGKQRKLESTDIVLADTEKPLDVAGVMGGKDTEIQDFTTTILLSASLFNPVMVRKTATRLGLHSEASKRFQHGLTRKNLLEALNAAVKMYQDLGGKLTGLTIVGDTEDQLKKVPLTLEKTNSLIGIELSKTEVENFLKKLNFELEEVEEGKWVVTPPYYRLDIEIEEDLIEEIARMYGYEKIPAKELVGELPEKIDQSLFDLIYNTKKSLADLGLTEIQSYSFFSIKALETSQIEKDNLIKVANPISSETEYMRNAIWPNLIEVVTKNTKQGYEDIAIFEVGKIYKPKPTDLQEPPTESYHLSIALMNNSENPIGELLEIFKSLNQEMKFEIMALERNESDSLEWLHPNRYQLLQARGEGIGVIAEVHPRFLNNFGIDKRVAILEISLDNSLS